MSYKEFMTNKKRRLFISIIFFIFIFWLPFLLIKVTTSSKIVDFIGDLPKSDAVIVFGAIVRGGEISPLHQERLDAGKEILFKKTDKIVVSNMEKASNAMKGYLLEKGVSSEMIEIDSKAEKTPDTCRFEKNNHPEGRIVIFVSQGFHLPRILYQCEKIGVEGIAFPAENLEKNKKSQYSIFTRFFIKSKRYIREAELMWLVILGVYK